MKTVLIADDEKIIRDGLAHLVQSQEGFEVIAVCKNGNEALRATQKNPPDIIVTDVRMPGLNGLEFIKELSLCHSKILVISGYAKFEYAQEAHRLGVFDYILKPIDSSAFVNLLYKIADEIDAQERIRCEKKKQLGLLAIQENSGFKLAIKNLQTELGVYFDNITPVVIGIKCSTQTPVAQHKKWIQELGFFLSQKFPDSIIFSYEWNLVCLFNRFSSREVDRFHKVIRTGGRELSCRLYCGIGMPAPDFFSVGPYYQMAFSALSLWCYHPERNVFVSAISEGSTIAENQYCHITLEQVASALKNADLETASKVVQDLWDRLIREVVPSKVIRHFLTQLMSLCACADLKDSDCFSILKNDLLLFRRYSCSLEQLKEDAIHLISDTIQMQKGRKIISKNAVLPRIIEYTRTSYNQNLTLDGISELFHINKSYLCKIFKDGTGTTYNCYLLNLRIEHAKQLLRDPYLKIYEIADQIGFQDTAYFSKMFKDVTGFSPLQYRQSLSHRSF